MAPLWAVSTEEAKITRYSGVPSGALGLAARNNGSVELELDIDARGMMRGARVLKGRPDLVQAAVRTVNGWQFEPAKHEGKGVRSKLNIILAFDFGNRR